MMIVLRPQGKLDLVGASNLQQKIERIANFASVTQKTWIIDLERVEFINHFGLTALVAARRYAKNKDCNLFLRNIKPPVQLMLEIAQLDQDFDLIPPENEAKETSLQGRNLGTTIPKSSDIKVSLEGEEEAVDLPTGQLKSISNLQRILANFRNRLQDHSGLVNFDEEE